MLRSCSSTQKKSGNQKTFMPDYNSAINICGVYEVQFHRALFYIRCCPKGKLKEGMKG